MRLPFGGGVVVGLGGGLCGGASRTHTEPETRVYCRVAGNIAINREEQKSSTLLPDCPATVPTPSSSRYPRCSACTSSVTRAYGRGERKHRPERWTLAQGGGPPQPERLTERGTGAAIDRLVRRPPHCSSRGQCGGWVRPPPARAAAPAAVGELWSSPQHGRGVGAEQRERGAFGRPINVGRYCGSL